MSYLEQGAYKPLLQAQSTTKPLEGKDKQRRQPWRLHVTVFLLPASSLAKHL